jgi:hypothetical protein
MKFNIAEGQKDIWFVGKLEPACNFVAVCLKRFSACRHTVHCNAIIAFINEFICCFV